MPPQSLGAHIFFNGRKQLLDGIAESKAYAMGSDLTEDQAFENTSTNVAASQMRNALNKLADTVTNPEEKKVRNEIPCTIIYAWLETALLKALGPQLGVLWLAEDIRVQTSADPQ